VGKLTLRLDDELHRRLRLKAVSEDTTIQAMVEKSLRRLAQGTPAPAARKR
jgi:predicted HicB family RNase H-like nuclease